MRRALVRTARAIYRATPFMALRRLYFLAFCRVVRGRRIQATIDGNTFDLDLGEIIDVSVFLQQYEPDVTAALRQYCRPGMTVLDIGANIGAHTLPMARLVGERGAVYAFEPTSFAYPKLERNLALNGLGYVHAVRAALSDENLRAQTIRYRASWRTDGSRADHETVVDFLRLDDWCESHGVDHVDLVKIDIDGNEYRALAGATRLLARSHPMMIMEAVWPHFADAGRNPFALLKRLGYRFWDAKTGEEFAELDHLGRRFPDKDPEMATSVNVIARIVE